MSLEGPLSLSLWNILWFRPSLSIRISGNLGNSRKGNTVLKMEAGGHLDLLHCARTSSCALLTLALQVHRPTGGSLCALPCHSVTPALALDRGALSSLPASGVCPPFTVRLLLSVLSLSEVHLVKG